MPITEPLNPLRCYCGKATQIYDSLFRRNFCSDECSTNLRLFLGGTDESISIVKEIKAGDFSIRGGVVTLHPTLTQHQHSKVSTIDKIDAAVEEQLQRDRTRATKQRELKKIGLPDNVIEEMLKCL